jgi:hypothetical protein
MVKYSSTRTIESITPGCGGIVIKLRKTNERRRAELMRTLAAAIEEEAAILARLSEIQERATPVVDADGKPKLDPDTLEQAKELSPTDMEAALLIVRELGTFRTLNATPVYLRWGVASIDGLEIDDRAATVEDLVTGTDIPDGLTQEILDAIQAKTDIPSDKKNESSSPSTPDAVIPQATQATNAATVTTMPIGLAVIAQSSTPSI